MPDASGSPLPPLEDGSNLGPRLSDLKERDHLLERLRQADAQISYLEARIADLELLERAARARVAEMAQRLAFAETGLDETAQQLALTETRLGETAQQLADSKMHLDAISVSRGWRALERYRRIRVNVARLWPRPR